MAGPRRFPLRSRSRRATSWGVGPGATGQNITGSVATLGNTVVAITVERITLIRLRGYLRLTLSTTNAALAGFRGAFGVGIATAEAVAAGVASLRTPLTDSEWDGWWFHSFLDVRSVTATIADGSNAAAVIFEIPVDTKSMRKVEFDDTVYSVLEVIEEGTASVRMQFDSRILGKLV